MKVKPDLSFWKLWNISFGFFGVQIAYALQSANISRIFSTLGADPHNLSYFWILPPLAGIIVQPIAHPLSVYRFVGGRTRHVPATQCRKLRHGSKYSHDFRTGIADVPRHLHQYGHATLQNDGGRHGE